MQNLDGALVHLAGTRFREAFSPQPLMDPPRDPFLAVFANHMDDGKVSRWHDHPEVLAAYSWNGEQTLLREGVLGCEPRQEENCTPA